MPCAAAGAVKAARQPKKPQKNAMARAAPETNDFMRAMSDKGLQKAKA
jgi:hypothetical protein